MAVLKRRALFSHDVGELKAFDSLYVRKCVTHKPAPSELSLAVVGSLFQSGVEGLLVSQTPESIGFRSQFLTSKCRTVDESAYMERFVRTMTSLCGVVIEEKFKKFPRLQTIGFFLTDLTLSCERRVAFVNTRGFPENSSIDQLFQPAFGDSLKRLIQAFKPLQDNLPIPKHDVLRSDIEAFGELFSSDLFASYCDSHQSFAHDNPETARSRTQRAGRSLAGKLGGAISLKTLSFSLLPFGAKIVDTVFGKLPGTIAEGLVKAVSGHDAKRLVMYDSSRIIKEMLMKQIGIKLAAQNPGKRLTITLK